jgi:hypothetical protein
MIMGLYTKVCLLFHCACSDGTINLQGTAVPKGCCGTTDFLYIYRGASIAASGPNVLVDNQQSADVTVSCSRGESFLICEKDGVIVTSSVKATFTAQATDCTPLGTGTWTKLNCKTF